MRLLKRADQVVISMGDFARGLKLLKSSASLDQECPIPYVNAARAYLGMNDLVAARRQVFFTAHLFAPVVLCNRLSHVTICWDYCYVCLMYAPPSNRVISPVRDCCDGRI